MNLGRGSIRLLLVAFIGWSFACAITVASREMARADRNHAAECQIRKQTIAQFDLQACLADPVAATRRRDETLANVGSWFMQGGYLVWLVPPFLITALGVILIAACAFVYRGFVAD
jgi:hypothetical protein